MKSWIVFALLVATVVAVPLYHQQDGDDLESIVVNDEVQAENSQGNEPDWQMVPDGDGNMHMVDANNVEEIDKSFNAWAGGVNFILFTRNNRNNGQTIGLNNVNQLRASNFNSNWPTRLIIHGWNNNGNSEVNHVLRNAYLDRSNFNVFTVDWGAGAFTGYFQAVSNIRDVGLISAQFLEFLNRNGMSFGAVTLVGHSLGGHTCGFVGKSLTSGRISSIAALDPAGPGFSVGNPNGRVHHTDAIYVEIIHTDIGRLGFDQPIGDASFYPNWGIGMPGCGIDLAGTCGHGRAFHFMAESIAANNRFWATRCSGWAAILAENCPSTGPARLMGGEPLNGGANGVYFLATNANRPFAQGPR